MEPNNFEKDFRKKLHHRTIEPSHKAWDRLDAMLSVTEEKRPQKKNKWLYIAASVVGFLLVGTSLFNKKEGLVEAVKTDVVIKENVKKDSAEQPALNVLRPVRTQIAVIEKESVQNENKKENKLYVKPYKILKNENNQIAESSIIIKNNPEQQSIENQNLSIENPKTESPDPILSTLEKVIAAKDFSKKKPKVKINAHDLLRQVDGELELSFREKVITTVNKNFQTVKVAVANRNQQE